MTEPVNTTGKGRTSIPTLWLLIALAEYLQALNLRN